MFIKVKVTPSSKKPEIIQKSEDSFDIKIKSKPKDGEANKEVVSVLADFLNISKSKIKLTKGHRQRSKIFEIL
ncbi:MAG: DUF167 domain-containing protein [Patescibacteria group bacterium]